MVSNTTKDRQKCWDYWCDYANIFTIDPFLSNIFCPIERDVIVTAFADTVRSGVYSKNTSIKVQGVTDSLTSISNTIKLAGKLIPLYRKEVKYQLIIQRMVQGYQLAKPPMCALTHSTNHSATELLQSGATLHQRSSTYYWMLRHNSLLLSSMC